MSIEEEKESTEEMQLQDKDSIFGKPHAKLEVDSELCSVCHERPRLKRAYRFTHCAPCNAQKQREFKERKRMNAALAASSEIASNLARDIFSNISNSNT